MGRRKKKRNPLKVVQLRMGESPICTGLFEMADTHGIPLADSLIVCDGKGWRPGLLDFCIHAVRAGWELAKAIQRVKTAYQDAGMHITCQALADLESNIRLVLEAIQRNTRSEGVVKVYLQ